MWRDGEDFVFDDNRAHRSINSTPHPRLILVVDFPRHDMPAGERLVNKVVMRVVAPASSVVRNTLENYKAMYKSAKRRPDQPGTEGGSIDVS